MAKRARMKRQNFGAAVLSEVARSLQTAFKPCAGKKTLHLVFSVVLHAAARVGAFDAQLPFLGQFEHLGQQIELPCNCLKCTRSSNDDFPMYPSMYPALALCPARFLSQLVGSGTLSKRGRSCFRLRVGLVIRPSTKKTMTRFLNGATTWPELSDTCSSRRRFRPRCAVDGFGHGDLSAKIPAL
ncbi:MAG: hypothetical protein V7608_5225 [Hyphomicrobiales bacterium]|jgi:hypothetical protein